ncbi:MAG: hypothetical protein HY729_11425, partial [Candidatus Rokubacteria bacterium]|nr:hypothetical protein [Candidatus Rokubacteria bacterium]
MAGLLEIEEIHEVSGLAAAEDRAELVGEDLLGRIERKTVPVGRRWRCPKWSPSAPPPDKWKPWTEAKSRSRNDRSNGVRTLR